MKKATELSILLRGGGYGYRDEPLRPTNGGVAISRRSPPQSRQLQQPTRVGPDEEDTQPRALLPDHDQEDIGPYID